MSEPKTMFVEIEQDAEVPRGYIKVTEIIAYDKIGQRLNQDNGKMEDIERGRAPYFCQDREDVNVFKENNPDARIETFTIQLLKSTAVKYINAKENVKQFTGKGAENA